MTFAWRPLRAGETDHETLWASVALALGILLACWLWLVEWPPVLCPFHVMTGLPCPTCGSTRAFFAFLSGQPLHALRLNPCSPWLPSSRCRTCSTRARCLSCVCLDCESP